jgi:hypothetical protein
MFPKEYSGDHKKYASDDPPAAAALGPRFNHVKRLLAGPNRPHRLCAELLHGNMAI